MTDHLMGGHAYTTALTLRAHSRQSVEHFVAVGYIEERFHFRKATLHIQMSARRKSFISQPRPKPRLVVPAQWFDATPSNQLIRQYFRLENRSVRLYSIRPRQGGVSFESTLP